MDSPRCALRNLRSGPEPKGSRECSRGCGEGSTAGAWRRRPDSNRRIGVLQTPPLDHLGTSPCTCVGCPSRIRTSVHGSKVRCPTTRRRGNDPSSPQRREWSGRRDSNPRPSHWQCDALPTEPLPHRSTFSGAESQIRTGDTALFRRVLYQLSYLGPTPAATRTYAPTAARIPSPAEGRNEAPQGRWIGVMVGGEGLEPPTPSV